MEEWKKVNGFPKYEVSSLGRVRSYHSGKVKMLNPGLSGPGKCRYRQVMLCNAGFHKPYKVATLVAIHFIGSQPKGYHVSHINEDRLDDRAINLCYETQAANNRCPLRRKRMSISYPIGKTGYRGVYKEKSGSYTSHIKHCGREIYLGAYKTAIEAALAFDKKAVEIREENAVTNKMLGLL